MREIVARRYESIGEQELVLLREIPRSSAIHEADNRGINVEVVWRIAAIGITTAGVRLLHEEWIRKSGEADGIGLERGEPGEGCFQAHKFSVCYTEQHRHAVVCPNGSALTERAGGLAGVGSRACYCADKVRIRSIDSGLRSPSAVVFDEAGQIGERSARKRACVTGRIAAEQVGVGRILHGVAVAFARLPIMVIGLTGIAVQGVDNPRRTGPTALQTRGGSCRGGPQRHRFMV